MGYVPERHIAKSDPYILMVWYLCYNVKSLTICEQSIQIQGMDLHNNYLQIAVIDEKGKVSQNSKINNNLKQVGRFFDENINDEQTRVVMESSCVWYNLYHSCILYIE